MLRTASSTMVGCVRKRGDTTSPANNSGNLCQHTECTEVTVSGENGALVGRLMLDTEASYKGRL